jgi:hypothetical protein
VAIVSRSRLGRALSAFIRALVWRGKEFTAGGSLRNIMTPFGVRTIRASVYEAPSRLDGRPSIVLDYSSTSRVASWVRDEIRQIAPGLYLGIVYVRGWRLPLRFTLHFPTTSRAR